MKRYPVQLDENTYQRLNKLAAQNGHSIVGEIRFMLDHFVPGKTYVVDTVLQLQPTPDAVPVPVYNVKET